MSARAIYDYQASTQHMFKCLYIPTYSTYIRSRTVLFEFELGITVLFEFELESQENEQFCLSWYTRSKNCVV